MEAQDYDSYQQHLDLEVWIKCPYHVTFERLRAFINSEHNISPHDVETVINILLSCLCLNGSVAEPQNVQATNPIESNNHFRTAQFIKSICTKFPSVYIVLFHHFQMIPEPLPFVNILPSILVGLPKSAVAEAFDILLGLVSNGQYTVSVLSVLLDLDLSLVRKQKVVQIAQEALSVTAEADFPQLFKLIFSNLNIFSGTSVIRKLREEISMLSADSVIVLLFENMMDVLPYFTTVANMILSDVFTDCDYVEFNQATRKDISLFDTVVVLVSMSMPNCVSMAHSILKKWLSVECFPVNVLISIMERRSVHEIWARLVPSLRKLLMWMFGVVQRRAEIPLSHSSYNNCKQLTSKLFVAFYSYNDDNREFMVRYLLKECFSCTGISPLAVVSLKRAASYQQSHRLLRRHSKQKKIERKISSLNIHGGKTVKMPRIGSSFRETHCNSYSETSRASQFFLSPVLKMKEYSEKLTLALFILENILHVSRAPLCNSGVSAVGVFLSFLLDRFRSSSQDWGGKKRLALPPPFALNRIIMLFSTFDAGVSGNESSQLPGEGSFGGNTAMITFQKLINSASFAVDHNLMQMLHLVHTIEKNNGESVALKKRLSDQAAIIHYNGFSSSECISSDQVAVESTISEMKHSAELYTASTDNFSCQGVGVLFAAFMALSRSFCNGKCTMTSEDIPMSSVSTSSTSWSNSHGSSPPHLKAFSEIFSVMPWITQYTSHFSDSSIFYAIDFFVCSLERALPIFYNSADPAFTHLIVVLMNSCEAVYASLLRNFSLFYRKEDQIITWRLSDLSSECVDSIIRSTASASSWATISEHSSSIFWIVHVIAKFVTLLDVMRKLKLLPVNNSSDFLSHLTIAHSYEFTVECRGKTELLEFKQSTTTYKYVEVKYFSNSDCGKSCILWPDCDAEYSRGDASNENPDSVAMLLKLSWEHALTADVLAANLIARCSAAFIESNPRDILLVLSNIAWGRQYIRRAAPFLFEELSCAQPRGFKSQDCVGSKRKRKLAIEHDEDIGNRAEDFKKYERDKTILRKNIGMECHLNQLNRCMDRVSMMLPENEIKSALSRMTNPIYYYAKSKSIVDLTSDITALCYDQAAVFSPAGLSCLSLLLGKVGIRSVTEGRVSSLDLNMFDMCTGFDECQSASNRDHAFKQDGTEFDTIYLQLVSLYPYLIQLSESLLLHDAISDKPSRLEEECGDILEYPMRSIVLSMLSVWCCNVFTAAWIPFLTNARALGSSPLLHSIWASDSTQIIQKLLNFMSDVEAAILESRDALVSFSGLRTLLKIAEPLICSSSHRTSMFSVNTIHQQLVSLTWKLATGLQTKFTSFSYSKHMYMNSACSLGKGILFDLLLNECNEAELIKSSFEHLDNANRDYQIFYMDILSLLAGTSKKKLPAEENYFFKFWSLYWALETPMNRIIGTHLSIGRIFYLLNAPKSTASKRDPTAAANPPGAPSRLFERMSHDNIDAYFRSMTVFLPLLFLSSRPNAHRANGLGSHSIDQRILTPYLALNLSCCLYSQLLDEFCILGAVDDTKSLKIARAARIQFAFNVFENLAKICKNTLGSLVVAVDRAVDWRCNVSVVNTDHASNSIMENLSYGVDEGDVSYLLETLRWAITCTKQTIALANIIKQLSISQTSRGIRSNNSVLKSVPSVSVTCDKVLSHLMDVLRRHGFRDMSAIDDVEKKHYTTMLQDLDSRYLFELSSRSSLSFRDVVWDSLFDNGVTAVVDKASKQREQDSKRVDEGKDHSWHVSDQSCYTGWGFYTSIGHDISAGSMMMGSLVDSHQNVIAKTGRLSKNISLPKKVRQKGRLSDEESFDEYGTGSGSDDSSRESLNSVSSKESFSSSGLSYDSDATFSDEEVDVKNESIKPVKDDFVELNKTRPR